MQPTDLRNSKVSELQVSPFINQDVLRLEVAVDDVHRVQVLDGLHDFCDVESGFFLNEEVFSQKQVVQVAPWHVLHHKANVMLVDEAVDCLHNALTLNEIQNLVFLFDQRNRIAVVLK